MTNTHCFSVDVEGFCESMAESFPVPEGMAGSAREREEIAANIQEILPWLEKEKVTGTFFVLGNIARDQPGLVRMIGDAGHEIASHSFNHLRLNNLPKETARAAIEDSKKALEDASGRPVIGFRAPDFSINAETLYLLDLVREAGYRYDASIYPIQGHDVYGIPGAKREIHKLENGLVEFPSTTVTFMGRTLPALGGGYLRLFPLWLTRWILSGYARRNQPAMFYTHPYEIASTWPRVPGMSTLRRFRHYVNMSKGQSRFSALFEKATFRPARDILKELNWL